MTSRPALAASASVSASNMTNAAFPPGPRAAIQARISGSRRRWLQTSSIDVNSRCVTIGRHDDARMAARERVEERDVEQVAHPAVDPQEVERRRRDEVDRRLVRPEELPDLGDAAQRAVGRGVDDGAVQHGLCSRICGSVGTCAEVDEPLDGLGHGEHGAVAPARPEYLHRHGQPVVAEPDRHGARRQAGEVGVIEQAAPVQPRAIRSAMPPICSGCADPCGKASRPSVGVSSTEAPERSKRST